MKAKAIVERVYNNHKTDEYGVTISDEFIAVYKSGVTRTFICRNRISKNVADFIKTHADNSESHAVTDKMGRSYVEIIWR